MADVEKLRYKCHPKLKWWIVATVTLLLLPQDCFSCQWIVRRCSEGIHDIHAFLNGSGLTCVASLVWADSDGTLCVPTYTKKVPANASHPCSKNPCTLLKSWCPWSAWVIPSALCGESARRWTRTRSKCCHPDTKKLYPYTTCHSTATGSDEKLFDYVPCKTQYYVAAVITVVILVIIVVIVGYIRSVTLARRRGRRPESPPPAVMSQMQTPAVDCSQPPSYEEAVNACENPSFEASRDDEQLPKYDDVVSRDVACT